MAAWVAIVLLAIVYFVYFSCTVKSSNGIDSKFFSFIVAIYMIVGLGLIGSTLFYTSAMHEMWGSSFDSATTRVSYLTFALLTGLLASSCFMIALIVCPEQTQLALTTGNTFSLLLPLAVMMYVHIKEFRMYRRQTSAVETPLQI